MDFPTDLVLLNTLFLSLLSYNAIGINAISLANALCQRLQIDRVTVWLDDIFSNRKAINGANKQTRPLCNIKFGVARYVNHHGTHHKTDICNQFRESTPNTS